VFHKFFEKGDWFEPKAYGYGAGWPIAWQGWVLLLGYCAFVIAGGLLAQAGPPWALAVFFAALIPLTLTVLFVARARTRGGWRWRWGGKE